MYGQGNHGPQFGQGLQRAIRPYQQHPTGHPPPIPQQPGPPFQVPPRPSGYPQLPHFPQNLGQHAPPISMPNTGNSFLHPPPNLHRGPPFQPPYPAAQQNYGPGMQNPNHALSLPLPPPPPSSPLCPPRAPQPPPPAHGQVVYGAQVPQVTHNIPQGIPDMPLQPPMRLGVATSFHPSNFESAKQVMSSESQIPSMAPPPPPLPASSPLMPPPPPSGSSPPNPPPPPSSSSPPNPPPPPSGSSPPKPSPPTSCSSPSSVNAVVGTSLQSGNDPNSVQVSVPESASDIATHLHSRDDMPASDEHLLPSQNVVVDLPPPPPKPEDETIVRNIEILCKYIAKNGPDFENTARQNGYGKPEFIFLFGGEPGSQASCAREYYLWMKKKYGLVGDRDLSQGHVGAECFENLNSVPAEGAARSHADSDVDMEDDITQSEKELGVYNFAEDLKPNSVSTGDVHEMHKQINDAQLSIDSSTLNLSQTPEQPIEPEQSVQANTVDSPIKLIQNYSSDGESDDNDDNVTCNETSKTMVESPPSKHQPTTSHSDMANDNITPKFGQVSEPGVDHSAPAYNKSVLTKDLDNFETVECGAQDKAYEIPPQEKSASNPSAAIQGNYTLENSVNYLYEKGSGTSGTNLTCNVKEKENKKTSSKSKVDEFGRLVKEGASESESDDSYLVRRHKRGRSRSRSPSRSPSDRRRRRRSPRWSPRRRKDRRSRSPRRSRSRSPHGHADRVSYEKSKRDKAQMPECFDFLKGRCYRGASCRYLHHEADKNESLRLYKSKQHQLEGMDCSRNSSLYGGDSSSILFQQINVVKDEKHDVGGLPSKSNDERSKAVSIHDAVEKDDETPVADGQKVEASTVEDPQFEVSEKPMHQENTNFDMPSTNEQVNHHSEAEASAQQHHRLDGEALKMDSASKVDSSTIQTHAVPSHEVHVSVSEPYPGNVSNMSAGASDLTSQPLIPHIPPPHLLQQAANAPQGSELVDHKSMVPAVGFTPQPAHAGNVPAYQAPLSNQQSQYPTPPNPVWGIMPPMQPRPPYISEPSMPGPPLHFPQFQQGNLSMRNDFPGQGSVSQVGGFQHQPYNLHLNNLPTQPFGGASLVRDDRYSQFPSQGVQPSSSFASPSVPPQSVPFSGDSTVKNMPSFPPGDSLPFNESSNPTFQNHSLSVSGYASDHLDRDSSRFIGIGGSKISAHYNPYASTFDQPLTTRFTSATFTQVREGVSGSKYDGSVGQTSGDGGLNKLVLSPNSSKAQGKSLPKSAGHQYDPLFDSIEPSAESFKKHVHTQDHVADNSDKLKMLSRHYKVLDVEENNKQMEIGAVAATMSLENDEFGETADAEVGAVENGSPSDPDEDAIVAEGEIEIDQVKPEGKTKKSKDSRSMKLFKIAVANFVKDVLKPQWRQGNMSKEVFKTIVKKTVDKVSSSMKNHRIPKSQEKIDHYIDSSRRKLTQLVEGYVSKYKS